MKEKNRWGFIALWRKTREHWLWNNARPRTKFEAWVDLLWLASHKKHKKLVGEELVILETGQRDLSVRFLMKRWKWNSRKVQKFLNLLEKDGMISTDVGTGQTIVTICNYETYQTDWRKVGTQVGTQVGTEGDTVVGTVVGTPLVQREELITINKNLKERKESGSFSEGINQPDSEYTGNDHIWALKQWKIVHERFNLHQDSYSGYLGLIIQCYKRIGKSRTEFGIKNFLNDSKSETKSITYFFNTGIDRYLMKKDYKKTKDHEAKMDRVKGMIG